MKRWLLAALLALVPNAFEETFENDGAGCR
jgi:hypothetical protein